MERHFLHGKAILPPLDTYRLFGGSQPDVTFRIGGQAVGQGHFRNHERNEFVAGYVQLENVFVLAQHPDVPTGIFPDLVDDIDTQSVLAGIVGKDFLIGTQVIKAFKGGHP